MFYKSKIYSQILNDIDLIINRIINFSITKNWSKKVC